MFNKQSWLSTLSVACKLVKTNLDDAPWHDSSGRALLRPGGNIFWGLMIFVESLVVGNTIRYALIVLIDSIFGSC